MTFDHPRELLCKEVYSCRNFVAGVNSDGLCGFVQHLEELLARGADQPPAQADQDRHPRRPPCPRHHLPAGRGRRHRPDGVRHPCCDPPIKGAAVMCVTAIKTQTKRNRLDRPVLSAANVAA